eukprot:6210649-Pleurochrysis_carterae.AAC.2
MSSPASPFAHYVLRYIPTSLCHSGYVHDAPVLGGRRSLWPDGGKNTFWADRGRTVGLAICAAKARFVWYRFTFILDDQPTRAHKDRVPSPDRATENAPRSAS